MSVGKIKDFGASIGSSISHSGDNIGHNIKHTFKKKKYDSEDELINQYQHDLKRSIKALSFILNQIHKISSTGLPKLFKSHMKSVELFSKLIGANALQFKGVDEYYHTFDIMQQTQEIPMIHPKEMQFEIPSLNEQLYNYSITIDKLTLNILNDWELFYQENKLRIIELKGYLKDCLKLIMKRNQKQDKYETIHKKLDKLMKKTTPLDDKEQTRMKNLEKDLKDVKRVYELLDEKTKTILPHVYLNLEQFIDSISKILLCKQLDTYKSFYKTLNYFSEYYGIMSVTEVKHDNDYESIITSWENAITPVRLQIETFITMIHEKNPELIDQEIDDEDKSLKASKVWNKLTRKMTDKTFSLKPKDHKNGLFNGYLIADQLDSFVQYNNPNYNRLDTYFPKSLIKQDDISIPSTELDESKVPPPPLPPRQNTATAKTLPMTPRIGLPVSLPSTPLPSTPMSTNYSFDRVSLDSELESIESASIRSDNDDDDVDDYDYDDNDNDKASATLSSISTSYYIDDNSKERMNRHLTKVYNSSKNQLKESPIHIENNGFIDIPSNKGAFDDTSTITHRLDEFRKYFQKLDKFESSMIRQTLVAKYDFNGVEPGDLSFKQGDKIEIIFQFNPSTPSPNGIWMVGIAHCGDINRIGLVPSSYF